MSFMLYLCAIIISQLFVVFGQANMPVFLGQNTPAVPPRIPNPVMEPNLQIPIIPSRQSNGINSNWQSNGNPQFGRTARQTGQPSSDMNSNVPTPTNTRDPFVRPTGMQVPVLNTRPFQRIRPQLRQGGTILQTFVPTQIEPWAPGEPRWIFPGPPRETCQRRGCPIPGTQCVFMGGFCPRSVLRVPCRCERGCRVGNQFIPFGQSKIVDQCNNMCRCTSREGIAQCTTRRC